MNAAKRLVPFSWLWPNSHETLENSGNGRLPALSVGLDGPAARRTGRRRSVLKRKCLASGTSILLATMLLLLLPHPGRAALTAKDIVARVMAAYGGQETVEKIAAVCARGRIVAFAFNDEGTYSYCVAKDRRLRVDIGYTNYTEHRALDGTRASVQSGDGSSRTLTGGPDYLSIVYQYEQLSLPRTLLDRGVSLRYEGRELRAGRPVEVLTLDSAGSPAIKIYVDAESGRIVETSGAFRMGGAKMVLSSVFSDFRKVGNTLLPFKFVNYAGSERIAETSIQGYELNPTLGGNFFLIPGATQFSSGK